MIDEQCKLGPTFCTRAICECDRELRATIDVEVRKSAGPRRFVQIASSRRQGKRLVAQMTSWKAHWIASASYDAVERAGVCIAGEIEEPEECVCPNCVRERALRRIAEGIRDEYRASACGISVAEAYQRADPIAMTAAAPSPWGLPLNMYNRPEDFGPELTKIRKWLDGKPIRWQGECVVITHHEVHAHDGHCRDQTRERQPQTVAK